MSTIPPRRTLQGSAASVRPTDGLSSINCVLRGPVALVCLIVLMCSVGVDAAFGQVVYRVNPGGPAVTSIDAGPDWEADLEGNPSIYWNAAATGDLSSVTDAPNNSPLASVPAGMPAVLFDTDRWDPGSGPEMLWQFPVTNGTYEVRLGFAEIYSGTQSKGARIFDVFVEGSLSLLDIDKFERYGGYTPAVETVLVDVSDGVLDIEFLHKVENTSLTAIEIVGVARDGYLKPTLNNVGFGLVEENSISSPLSVDLVNAGLVGDQPITITGVTVTGEFTTDLVPQTLNPGETLSFNVNFAPTTLGLAAESLTINHSGSNAPLVLALTGDAFPEGSVPIGFGVDTLLGTLNAMPTTLQWGPDGRLYVGQQDGIITVYTVERVSANNYQVVSLEIIDLIQQIPNHDDDGSLNPTITTRQLTGLLVTGTFTNPAIYVSSSDSRISLNFDSGLDTNSGMVTRLTWNGATWDQLDLVRGLPRSEENHAVNGMALDAVTNTLYLCSGGNTNAGAPSDAFSQLPEYALAAAVLSIDLDAIGNTTYDLPTLDDPTRPNTGPGGSDENDPFGGNDGSNQAMLTLASPVQVYSPGYRNAYDVVISEAGRMYVTDNGPNIGWGAPAVNEGPLGLCTNDPNESGSFTWPDQLHYVDGPGYYGGHPNPFRANMANTINGVSPVEVANPVECDFRSPGVEDGALATFPFSTNGITEYTASNFEGTMRGDLLMAGWGGTVERAQLTADGSMATNVSTLFSNTGPHALDITAQGDTGPFPGTIWVASHALNQIKVYEPNDFGGGTGVACTGVDDNFIDEDGDGYTNGDEIDNGTDPCSAADVPSDFDADLVSDRNDDDDDNDGILDVVDSFQHDPFNGFTTPLPVSYTWEEGSPGFGFLSLGFTGFMTNGTADYLDLLDETNVTAGGAAGKFTIDNTPPGDALGGNNDQEYSMQLGVDVNAATGPFSVHTRVDGLFFNGNTPVDNQSLGMYLGTGDQDNYVKIALAANGGAGGIEVVLEDQGVPAATMYSEAVLGASNIHLYLSVDPVALTVQARYALDAGPVVDLGTPLAIAPGSPLAATLSPSQAMAAGIIATSRGATPFTSTWDLIEVVPDSMLPTGAAAVITATDTGDLDTAATETAGALIIDNQSLSGERITRVSIDLSWAVLSDLVFDPAGIAGDLSLKCVTADSDVVSVGYTSPADPCVDPFSGPHDGGYDAVELTFTDFDPGETFAFSLDVDPTSIQGAVAPGPDGAGHIAGVELVGSAVTIEFDDGSVYLSELFFDNGTTAGGRVEVGPVCPPRPGLQALDTAGSQGTVIDPNQTMRVSAAPGSSVRLLRLESALSLEGAGFDIDPFEANRVVAVAETSAVVGVGGYVDIPVTLTMADSTGGINVFAAAAVDGTGKTGLVSTPVTLQLLGGVVTDALATVAIDPGTGIGATTISPGSFQITNESPSGQMIQRVRFNLSSSLLPDLVFDPVGSAGDVDGLCFTPNSTGGTQPVLPPNPCSSPFSSPHDGGYDAIEIAFNDFGPGETFTFSVDVDPTSIQGATGVGGPGGVSGLELAGTTVSVEFDDGSILVSETYRIAGSNGGSSVDLFYGQPAAPTIAMLGATADPTTVGFPNQTIRVTGEPGLDVSLLVVEAALIVGGQFGPGFDLDPFEANEASIVTEYSATVQPGGSVDIPVLLTDTGGSFNHLMAVQRDGTGRAGRTSNVLVVELDASSIPLPTLAVEPTSLDFGSVAVGDSAVVQVQVIHEGAITDPSATLFNATFVGFQSEQFSVETSLPVIIAGSDTMVVDVKFLPTDSGTKNVTLALNHSGANTPVYVPVTGVATGGPAPTVLYRVNAGGPAIAGWDGDDGATFASPYNNWFLTNLGTFTNPVDMTDPSLPANTPPELFLSERWDHAAAPEMQWDFPVPPGDYEVVLYLADSYIGTQSVGARVFDVHIDFTPVLIGVDLFAQTGGYKGISVVLPVTDIDGNIDLDFIHGIENPLVNAVEVRAVQAAPSFDLYVLADSLVIDCEPNAMACLDGAYAVAGDPGATTNVEFSFYRDDPGVGANLLGSFTDMDVAVGDTVSHQLCIALGNPAPTSIFVVVDPNLTVEETNEGNNSHSVALDCSATAAPVIPARYVLGNNAPNPFNPATVIPFALARSGRASLRIYDVSGRLVNTLVDEHLESGAHEFLWRGLDTTGRQVASGVYYYQLRSLDYIETKRMTLLK